MFGEMVAHLSPTSIAAYTDGSLEADSSVSCAVFIEGRLQLSQRLARHTSIFSAELHAIKIALQFLNSIPEAPEEIAIFTDSKSSVEAISGIQQSQCHAYIKEIRKLANEISSMGTRISLVWIPSRVGIEENENADQLANSAHRNADQSVQSNVMTARELSRPLREAWLDSRHPPAPTPAVETWDTSSAKFSPKAVVFPQ